MLPLDGVGKQWLAGEVFGPYGFGVRSHLVDVRRRRFGNAHGLVDAAAEWPRAVLTIARAGVFINEISAWCRTRSHCEHTLVILARCRQAVRSRYAVTKMHGLL
jgi:hypothetical protein